MTKKVSRQELQLTKSAYFRRRIREETERALLSLKYNGQFSNFFHNFGLFIVRITAFINKHGKKGI
jgi:hypothetical protein